MTRLIFYTFLLAVSYMSLAQSYRYSERAVVYYRDGSVFLGQVISMQNNTIRYALSTGDTISIKHEMIKKYISSEDIVLYNNGRHHYKSKIFAAFSAGIPLSYNASTRIELTIARRMLEKYAFGLTGGIHAYDTSYGGLFFYHEFYTLTGFARYYINERKARLFAESQLGIGFANESWFWDERHSDGLHGQLGIGILLPSKNKFRWSFALTGSTQYTQGRSRDFGAFSKPVDTEYKFWLSRANLKIGLEFN